MPSLRKLSEAEIAELEQPTPGPRTQVAQEYDAYLAGFVTGDYGRAGEAEIGKLKAEIGCRRFSAFSFQLLAFPALPPRRSDDLPRRGATDCRGSPCECPAR